MKKRNVFLLGALLGAGAVALLTPKSGKDMQKDILKTVDDVQTKIKDIDVEDVRDAFIMKLDEVKDLVADFDWEASKSELEFKVSEVKQKLNDMLERVEEAKTTLELQAEEIEEELEDDFTIVIDTMKDAVTDVAQMGSEVVDTVLSTETEEETK